MLRSLSIWIPKGVQQPRLTFSGAVERQKESEIVFFHTCDHTRGAGRPPDAGGQVLVCADVSHALAVCLAAHVQHMSCPACIFIVSPSAAVLDEMPLSLRRISAPSLPFSQLISCSTCCHAEHSVFQQHSRELERDPEHTIFCHGMLLGEFR